MGKNDVTLQGFVRKIDLRFSQSGTPVLNINVPIDRRRLNKDTNQWESENTTWWQLTTFGADAEYQAERLREGDYIYFTGMPEIESREHDGKTYTNAIMKFPDIALGLKAPKDRQNAQGQPQGGQRPQGGGNTQHRNSGPAQGGSDPWGQSQQSYDWNQSDDQEAPF